MTQIDLINNLSVLLLLALLVASIFLFVLLYRANRLMYKLDHLSETAGQFVKDIVPAIVNMGTISTAVEAMVKTVSEHLHEFKKRQ